MSSTHALRWLSWIPLVYIGIVLLCTLFTGELLRLIRRLSKSRVQGPSVGSVLGIIFSVCLAILYILPAFVDNASLYDDVNTPASDIRTAAVGTNPFVAFSTWITGAALAVLHAGASGGRPPTEVLAIYDMHVCLHSLASSLISSFTLFCRSKLCTSCTWL